MTDQTRWGIDEVMAKNRAKKYEDEKIGRASCRERV